MYELDYSLAMEKLYDLFDIHTLMLGGGGILNWSFIQAEMCDEILLPKNPPQKTSYKLYVQSP